MKHLQKSPNKIYCLYIFAVALFFASAFWGVMCGSSQLSISEILKAFSQGFSDSPEARIIWFVRLPRVLGALLCGAALSVSGAVIQRVLSNRLASPSIIGVNSGAGLAVTLCSAMGIYGGWMLSFFAFCGAFLAVLGVSICAKKWNASKGTVILLGVAVNCLLGAISDAVITFVPDISFLSVDFRVGDFSSCTYAKIIPASIIILTSLLILQTLSNELDVLSLDDNTAKSLGLNVNIIRIIFLLLAALLAGSAVSICGLLSFVGLLVPHVVRRICGPQSKYLLPLCALSGAGFVTFCDTFSRILFAPYEISVGIIIAFLGIPFFIFILVRGKGGATL